MSENLNITKKAGVIGNPISHSKSPLIHGFWLENNNIDGSYEAFDVKPVNLGKFLKYAKTSLVGFNITVPHKQAIMEYCDSISTVAKVVGAVNMVLIKDGKLYGDNTDVYGFSTALVVNIKNQNATLNLDHAIIIGAGGASRASIVGLKNLGFNRITIVNRTLENAEKLAVEFGVEKIALADINKILPLASLVVNTSIAGLNNKNNLDLNLGLLNKQAIVYDIVYQPIETAFLKQAKSSGIVAITGIDMLLYQAVDGFRQWFGVKPIVNDTLRKKVLK